ncbi:RidA family protein [Larkinella humicola]|uniref:RidA family protein n=1 Tax=Larkinella humicola TaxID=2607654 RepID=A0A5N1JJE1_9BACT|nr:RidA family protein [Larkinella humicola]KAA9354920.1 RidA family protein [Larkinella humicola]
MKKFVISTLVLFSTVVFNGVNAQSGQNAIEKQKFHFGKAGEDGAGYAQAVRVGKTIYISGTVGGGEAASALTNVYKGLQKTLAFYGATFQNVVKENLYTTNIEEMKKHNDVRKKYYNNDFPAATWVQIQRLYEETALVEVELVAMLP